MDAPSKPSSIAGYSVAEHQASSNIDGARGFDDLARADQPTQYFPAIDGLRGILALSTILMHVNREWFPGAPAVMDIFFVLSGFLITLQLLNHARRHGGIELKKFWVRRIKRLYPALILVVGAYLLLASLLMDQLALLYLDGMQTLLYVSNWAKLYNVVYPSYFAHTWSLSIEEQFYLLWPPCLLLMYRWKISRAGLITSCLLLVGSTFIWRHHLIGAAAPWSRIYYGSDTRIDAFLMGGVLAISWQRWRMSWYRKPWLNLAAQTCVIVLLAAVTAWNPWQVEYFVWHQSAVILLSCGTIVALASPSNSFVTRLLSVHPLRRLGLMCYGIYLWHWPMIWLLMIRFHMKPLPILCMVVPTTLALAYISYRYVEAPILSGRSKAA